MDKGILYVVSNKWINNPETQEMPYKIGITRSTVDDRFYGLGLKMPGKFETLFAYKLDNCAKAEQLMHGIFNKYRVNGEWFNITEKELELIKANCETMGGVLVTNEIENEIQTETTSNNNVEELSILFGKTLEEYKAKGISIVWQTKYYIYWVTEKMDKYFPVGEKNTGTHKDGRKYHYLFDVRGHSVHFELCPYKQDNITIDKMNKITNKTVTPKDKYRRTNSKKLKLNENLENSIIEIRNAIEYLLNIENDYLKNI